MHLLVSVYLGVLNLSSRKWVKALESMLKKEKPKLSRSKSVLDSVLVQQINPKKLDTEKITNKFRKS